MADFERFSADIIDRVKATAIGADLGTAVRNARNYLLAVAELEEVRRRGQPGLRQVVAGDGLGVADRLRVDQ